MTLAYYNEIDPFAAAWLRELIKAGEIAPGDVDERDIRDVTPSDLAGYTQCHFFAGIGVWSYALRRAGWPDNRPVWTGSCPCQPWSDAGAVHGSNKAEKDERDLYPEWSRLIHRCKPDEIFGEQVASRAAMRWFDRLADDLEGIGYTIRAAVTQAAAFGQSQRRSRIYFTANSGCQRGERPSTTDCFSGIGSGRWCGKEDMRQISENPLSLGPRFPQPLIRSVDDGTSTSLGRLRGYGNAINAVQAQTFIEAVQDTIEH